MPPGMLPLSVGAMPRAGFVDPVMCSMVVPGSVSSDKGVDINVMNTILSMRRSCVGVLLLCGIFIFSTARHVVAADSGQKTAGSHASEAKAPDKTGPKTIPELEAEIRKVMQQCKVPACGVAIVTKDRIVWAAGLGKADVAANRDATADTLFRIASCSKSFTALAVMKLVEEGKLHLDDKVHDLIPEIWFKNPWEATDPVRVIHLLEHTAGFDDFALKDYLNSDPKPLTLREGLDFDPGTRVSRWRPGTRYSYCNSDAAMAAYIVEKITGQKFEDYMQQNFFNPLQFKRCSYLLTPEVQAYLAQGYHEDGITPYPYAHILERPVGAINISANEIANYLRFYLDQGSLDGVKILSPESIESMERPSSTYAAREGLLRGYGSFLCRGYYKGHPYLGHIGFMSGASAYFTYYPQDGIGYAFMINASNGEAFFRIKTLLQNYCTGDFTDATPVPAPIPIPRSIVSEYSGIYEPIAPRNEGNRMTDQVTGLLSLSFKGDSLIRKDFLGGETEYHRVSGSLYRKQDDSHPCLALIPDHSDGTLFQEMEGPGEMPTYRKMSFWRLAVQFAMVPGSLLLMASSLLWSLYSVPRNLLWKKEGWPALTLWLLSFITVLSLVAYIILMGDDFGLAAYAHLSFKSGLLYLSSVVYAMSAVAALCYAAIYPWIGPVRGVWWYNFAVALASCAIAMYLAYYGLIGLKTWE